MDHTWVKIASWSKSCFLLSSPNSFWRRFPLHEFSSSSCTWCLRSLWVVRNSIRLARIKEHIQCSLFGGRIFRRGIFRVSAGLEARSLMSRLGLRTLCCPRKPRFISTALTHSFLSRSNGLWVLLCPRYRSRRYTDPRLRSSTGYTCPPRTNIR